MQTSDPVLTQSHPKEEQAGPRVVPQDTSCGTLGKGTLQSKRQSDFIHSLSFQTALSSCGAIDVRDDDRGSKVGLLTLLCTYVT